DAMLWHAFAAGDIVVVKSSYVRRNTQGLDTGGERDDTVEDRGLILRLSQHTLVLKIWAREIQLPRMRQAVVAVRYEALHSFCVVGTNSNQRSHSDPDGHTCKSERFNIVGGAARVGTWGGRRSTQVQYKVHQSLQRYLRRAVETQKR